MGKVYQLAYDYSNALNKFQDCYNIRKKIISNEKHQDVIRISFLIINLISFVNEELKNKEINLKYQEML